MPMVSREVSNVPERYDPAWFEKVLREHYEDIKALCNKLLIENWRLEQDSTTGDYKIMEWNASTETWDYTGESIKAS
jgi:hypothetical protein